MRAQFLGIVNGRRAFKVPVLVICNDSQRCCTVARFTVHVISHTSTDAVNWVRDGINRPETELIAYGPQGGIARRYIGWESAIGRALECHQVPQPKLPFTL